MIDLRCNHLLRIVSVATSVDQMAVDQRSGHLLVGGPVWAGRTRDIVLDTAARHVLQTLALSTERSAIVADDSTGHVFITGTDFGFRAVPPPITPPKNPGQAALTRAAIIRSRLVVTGTVTMVSGASGHTLALPGQLARMAAVDGPRGHLFVITYGRFSPTAILDMISTRTGRLIRAVPLRAPTVVSVVASERSRRLFVRDAAGSITTVDTRSGLIVGTSTAPAIAPLEDSSLTVDDAHGRVVATGPAGTDVVDARTGRLLRAIPVSGDTIAVDTRSGYAYVTQTDVEPGQPSPLAILFGPYKTAATAGTAGNVVVIDPARHER